MTAELQNTSPFLEAERALEQDYFDRAMDALEVAISRSQEPSSGGTAVERRALAAAAERRQRLEVGEPVAFGRVDLEDAETRYIGKVAIRDEKANILVYQWQSPAADCFHQATETTPLGVARKRTFDAPFNSINSFKDTLYQQLSEEYAQLEEFSSPADPLLEDLGRQRDTQMRDIVRTIQADQNRLIRHERDQLLVIQGGPGTGKTAVALHRVSWLLHNYDDLAAQDVLVVGPNPTFTKYIQRVLPDLGDDSIVQQSLDQLLRGGATVRGLDDPRVARLKGSASMAQIVIRGINKRVKIPSAALRFKRRGSAAVALVTELDIKAALKDLPTGTYAERRQGLRRVLLSTALSRLPVLGKIDPETVFEPASVESELDKVWPSLSPQQFIRDLYGSKERLKAAGATPSQVNALYRAARPRISDEPWTASDLAVLDLATHAIHGTAIRYGHIVVDEAQDLSVMQLKAIRRRSRSGSMTVVGDIAQSTSAYARQDWDQVLKELSTELPSTLEDLKVGYRVPRQVLAVAERVLEKAAIDVQVPRAMRDVQEPPRWLVADSQNFGSRVVEAVKEHSARGLFVGVIATEHLWPVLRQEFSSAGLRWKDSADGGLSQGINLVSPEDSKGLEFDAVVLVDPQRILNETQGERLLYVALTRTIHFLDVVMPEGRIPEILGAFVDEYEGAVGAEEYPSIDFHGSSDDASPTSDEDHVNATSAEISEHAGGGQSEGESDPVPSDRAGHNVPASSGTVHRESTPDGVFVPPAVTGNGARNGPESVGQEKEAGAIVNRNSAVDAREGGLKAAASQIVPLSNPHSEALAQDLARRIVEQLEEETGRVGQKRVVALLIERFGV